MRIRIEGLLVLGLIGSVHGHHSFDYHFSRDIGVKIEGSVKEFRFINPHSRILIDVTEKNGEIVTWDCEMAGSNTLARRGWHKELFQPGQSIEITGFGHRRVNTECSFGTAVLEDGTRITLNESRLAGSEEKTQSRSASSPPRPADQPNFSRVWKRRGGGGMGPQLGGPNRNAWVLSEAGKNALEDYDPVTDDPALQCSPVSIARLWGTGDLTEIRQEKNHVTIHHEWMDTTRVVYLDKKSHPENLEEYVLGHSIGWYEDSVLVIDTKGYATGMLQQHPGLPHSNQLHTVEHLSLDDDGLGFEVNWTANDSEYFTDQLSGSRSLEASDGEMKKYNCTHPETAH